MSYFLSLAFDSPELIIWSACVGFNVAMIISFLLKRIEGTFISSLLSLGASSKESAVTLSQLGQDGNKALKWFLKDGSTLRNTVYLVGDSLPTKSTKKRRKEPVFDNARFYIPEDKLEKAESIGKGGLRWYFLPIYAILSVIITIIVIELLPILTNF